MPLNRTRLIHSTIVQCKSLYYKTNKFTQLLAMKKTEQPAKQKYNK